VSFVVYKSFPATKLQKKFLTIGTHVVQLTQLHRKQHALSSSMNSTFNYNQKYVTRRKPITSPDTPRKRFRISSSRRHVREIKFQWRTILSIYANLQITFNHFEISSRFCILASGILSFPKQGTALADISQSIFYFIELSRGLYVGNIYLGLSRN